MAIERIYMENEYSAVESSIHLNRYLTAKPYVAGKNVLDISCGVGYGTKFISSWGAKSVIGADISVDTIEVAKKNFEGDGISFLVCNGEAMPFEDNSFDVLVSYETIEHVPNPERFLSEIKRVVKDDGVVIISCPNDPFYKEGNPKFENEFHLRDYTWFDFKEISEKVLGEAKQWSFGFSVDGFINLNYESLNNPSDNSNIEPLTMGHIFENQHIEEAYKVSQTEPCSSWSASYYTGFWGIENRCEVRENVVSFSKPFIDISSIIYSQKIKIQELETIKTNLEKELETTKETFESKLSDSSMTTISTNMRLDRVKALHEIQTKDLNTRYEAQLASYQTRLSECSAGYEAELSSLNARLALETEKLNLIENSVSYKALRKLLNLIDAVKNIFTRS